MLKFFLRRTTTFSLKSLPVHPHRCLVQLQIRFQLQLRPKFQFQLRQYTRLQSFRMTVSSLDEDVPLTAFKNNNSMDIDRPILKKESFSSDISDDDNDAPIVATRRRKALPKQDESFEASDDDDNDDVPLSQQKNKRKARTESPSTSQPKPAKKRKTTTSASASKTKTKAKPKSKTKTKTTASKKKDTTPKAKKTRVSKVKIEEDSINLKKEATPDLPEDVVNEEEANTYKWWEQQDLDGEMKWESLEHNGVVFPPEYEPLPKHVKLIYDGKPVTLPPEAEEVAGFFGALVETDHGKNPVFQKNFFHDFLEVLKESGGCADVNITQFSKCDFSQMFAHFEIKKEEKKAVSPQEKKRLKKEKDEFEEKYKYCMLNGRREQVGNFRIEPPGLFRGRGLHPKTGKLKRRVKPENVTLNIGKDVPIPEPPAGHEWGEIRHDNSVAWLAMWRENISNSVKYVRFAQNSSLKGISDFKKFEKARELKKYIDVIRKDYKKKMKSELMIDRQIATATYLIDVFALRAGGDKSDEEADTVGCCSLRYEHVFLKPPSTVVFDFLGKDSIRYYQEVSVDKQVFKNLRIFKKSPKKPGDDLFDRLDPSILNKYFQGYLQGLTAKVFRTYNASKTMQDQLDLISNEGTINEKVVKFNAANRAVAILCNHQRTISKNHETGVQKINERIEEMLWQKIKLKRTILQIDKKEKKKNPDYFQELEDLTKEEETLIVDRLIRKDLEKIEKKFERDQEKLKFEKKELKADEYKTKLQEIKDDHKVKTEKHKENSKQMKAELKSRKYEIKSSQTVEKLQQQIEKLETRIKNTTLQLQDKEDNSSVALGTSKMNYIDPRLTVMFAKKYEVPIEKLFTKTLREKFEWAIESTDADWKF